MIRPETIVASRLALLDAIAPAPAVPDAARDLFEFTPGARVQARVEAQLADGGFRVLVAKTPMQMQLPPGIRPGATLELMFVGGEPRPTFVLLNSPAVVESHAALSPTARLVSQLAQEFRAGPAAAPPYQAAPVLEKPPTDVAEFSARLQQAFSQSGLFYESHQAQWLAGRRTREQLLHEPQGGLPAAAAPRPAKTAPAASATRSSASGATEPAVQSPPPARPDSLPVDAQPIAERLVHKDALPLVQQQLAALDSGQMQWRGEVWPGQTLDWEISSESPERGPGEETRCWRSRLQLTLPRLGEVTALLAYDAQGVRIAVSAESATAAATLRGGQTSLAHALQESGLNLCGIEIRADSHERE